MTTLVSFLHFWSALILGSLILFFAGIVGIIMALFILWPMTRE